MNNKGKKTDIGTGVQMSKYFNHNSPASQGNHKCQKLLLLSSDQHKQLKHSQKISSHPQATWSGVKESGATCLADLLKTRPNIPLVEMPCTSYYELWWRSESTAPDCPAVSHLHALSAVHTFTTYSPHSSQEQHTTGKKPQRTAEKCDKADWNVTSLVPTLLAVTMVTWPLTHWHLDPGPHLNIKTLYPRYGDSHVKDKMVARPSYL